MGNQAQIFNNLQKYSSPGRLFRQARGMEPRISKIQSPPNPNRAGSCGGFWLKRNLPSVAPRQLQSSFFILLSKDLAVRPIGGIWDIFLGPPAG
jgi:hypothetical protein